jgi:hypothetical protein
MRLAVGQGGLGDGDEEPGHLLGAGDLPQRSFGLASAVAVQHDIGRQHLHQRFDAASDTRLQEPDGRGLHLVGVGLEAPRAPLEVLAGPVVELAYGVRGRSRIPAISS